MRQVPLTVDTGGNNAHNVCALGKKEKTINWSCSQRWEVKGWDMKLAAGGVNILWPSSQDPLHAPLHSSAPIYPFNNFKINKYKSVCVFVCVYTFCMCRYINVHKCLYIYIYMHQCVMNLGLTPAGDVGASCIQYTSGGWSAKQNQLIKIRTLTG